MSYLPSRRLLFLSAMVALLALAVLAGCALDPVAAPTPTPPPPSPTPLPRGGNLTVRVAEDVTDLRPWQPRSRGEEQVIGLMYNGLMRLDEKLQPQPDLAARWDASADGRTITFTLRANLLWHDGTPLTSGDVAYTLNALREISPTNALLADFRARIADVATPTTDTAIISLTERYAPILSELAVPILPRHLLTGRDLGTLNLWDVPVGTGPFRLEARDPGTSITLSANQTYHRGQPLLDRVVLLVAPSAQVVAEALRDGRLLAAEVPWGDGPTITQTVSNLQTGSYAENGYYYLAFNTRDGHPFVDPQVREALALAVDVPALVRDATGALAQPVSSSAAVGSWADFTPAPTSTVDLDRARVLLDEAGWQLADGGAVRQQGDQTLEAAIFVRGDDERRVRAAEIIAEAGRTIGISLTVQPADFGTVIRSKFLPPYDFELLVGSWSNGAGDPQFGDYLFYDPDDFALFHESQINVGPEDTRATLNIGGFNDGVYNNQAGAARQLYEQSQRTEAQRRAQERITALRPYLFLWADRSLVVLNPQVTTLDGPPSLNSPLYWWNIERWHFRR